MTAAQRLSDALRFIESVDVRFNIAGTSVILAGLVMNSYTPLIDMCPDIEAPFLLNLSWIAALLAGLICYGLLTGYHNEELYLSRHMEDILLRKGMFVQVFDQVFAEEAPKTMWGKALRSRRSLALSSDSLVTRIVGMVQHYHFLCRKMGLPPRPRHMQQRLTATRFWLALTLLSGPLLLLLGLVGGQMNGNPLLRANSDVFNTLYLVLDEISYQLAFLPTWLVGIPKIALLAALAYFVLLWPALRLLPVIERAILRRTLHDIVEYDGSGKVDHFRLRQAEQDLTALRERVEESHSELARRGIRLR